MSIQEQIDLHRVFNTLRMQGMEIEDILLAMNPTDEEIDCLFWRLV